MRTTTPYLIAEMGVNFYDTAKAEGITPLEAAKRYIDGAAEAGCDCAKFQSYKAGTIVSKNSPAYWDLTKEPTKTQYDLFKKHDSFGEAEFAELCEYTHSRGMDFTSIRSTTPVRTTWSSTSISTRFLPPMRRICPSSSISAPRVSRSSSALARAISPRPTRLLEL